MYSSLPVEQWKRGELPTIRCCRTGGAHYCTVSGAREESDTRAGIYLIIYAEQGRGGGKTVEEGKQSGCGGGGGATHLLTATDLQTSRQPCCCIAASCKRRTFAARETDERQEAKHMKQTPLQATQKTSFFSRPVYLHLGKTMSPTGCCLPDVSSGAGGGGKTKCVAFFAVCSGRHMCKWRGRWLQGAILPHRDSDTHN